MIFKLISIDRLLTDMLLSSTLAYANTQETNQVHPSSAQTVIKKSRLFAAPSLLTDMRRLPNLIMPKKSVVN